MNKTDDNSPSPTRPRVVGIRIEWSDGTVEGAAGDDADAIFRAWHDGLVMSHVHGVPYRGPKLKVIREAGD